MTALSDSAKRVREALIARGIETPMQVGSSMTAQEKKEKIEYHMREILTAIDLDLEDILQENHKLAQEMREYFKE